MRLGFTTVLKWITKDESHLWKFTSEDSISLYGYEVNSTLKRDKMWQQHWSGTKVKKFPYILISYRLIVFSTLKYLVLDGALMMRFAHLSIKQCCINKVGLDGLRLNSLELYACTCSLIHSKCELTHQHIHSTITQLKLVVLIQKYRTHRNIL